MPNRDGTGPDGKYKNCRPSNYSDPEDAEFQGIDRSQGGGRGGRGRGGGRGYGGGRNR